MQGKSLISNAVYHSSHNDWKKLPLHHQYEYAFIGRSNVGKSSLINLLTGRKKLALVSKTPGKTKALNLFLINNEWNLVDLPGYGYAKASKSDRYEWSKSIESYLRNRKNLVNTFVLIDSNIPPQAIDISFLNFMGENLIPFSIVFTKIDKSSKNQIQSNIAAFKKELLNYWEEFPVYFTSSSVSNAGKDDILAYIDQLNKEISSASRHNI